MEEVAGSPRSSSFGSLILLEQVGSTNHYARRLVERAEASGGSLPSSVVVGYEQTAGRGRLGRRWRSPPGLGLYMTWVLPLPSSLETLPLVCGVGLCQALHRICPSSADVALKWPNDVLVNGRKAAGILIEVVGNGPAGRALLGMGVNHGHRSQQLPTATSTSVRNEVRGAIPTLGSFLIQVLETVATELAGVEDLPAAARSYRQWIAHRPGDPLSCRMGTRTVDGQFHGVADSGHLLLSTANGIVEIAAGEVVEPHE